MRSIFLRAEWRKLAILNFSIDPSILKPHLPFGTELDLWNEKCYVSLVAFRFINTRVKGVPVPFHINFEEINFRLYVKYYDKGMWKRGVTFIREIVSKPAMTFVANAIYKEKYITLPTKHTWIHDSAYIKVKYEWKHTAAWDSVAVSANPLATDILPGSEEEFITEHYWGYTRVNDKSTTQYEVAHPRWQVYAVNDFHVNVRFGELYGKEFAFLNDAKPDSVMLSEGSEVVVRLFDKIHS